MNSLCNEEYLKKYNEEKLRKMQKELEELREKCKKIKPQKNICTSNSYPTIPRCDIDCKN